MLVLGIETSCDETAVAIYDGGRGLLAHHIYSQVLLHGEYGGVVPELAARDHIRRILPLIHQAIKTAGIHKKELEGIAYTKGPGLIGALMVGAAVAKSLGYALNIKTIGVHHLESHLMVSQLESPKPQFPLIALLVSGGHTLLMRVNSFKSYEILGETIDDAVGEAFDKTAKLLGLPYPGGPALAALALEGNSERFHFPRPLIDRPNLNFSFSGLKTHAVNCFNQHRQDPQTRADIACAFEDAVVDVLVEKSRRALEQTGLNRIVMVGGVAANKKLRHRLADTLKVLNAEVFYPRFEYCTDNGAMVAYNGWLHLMNGESEDLAIEVKARWPINEAF